MKLITVALAVALAYTLVSAAPSYRVYGPMVAKQTTYVIPDYIETPPLPYGYFAASASMLVDATGTVFAVATTNGRPGGGVCVFRLAGAAWIDVLCPGQALAYTGGELQIGGDGGLYFSVSDEAQAALRQWRISEWQRWP
jgi:hypothetical protein